MIIILLMFKTRYKKLYLLLWNFRIFFLYFFQRNYSNIFTPQYWLDPLEKLFHALPIFTLIHVELALFQTLHCAIVHVSHIEMTEKKFHFPSEDIKVLTSVVDTY